MIQPNFSKKDFIPEGLTVGVILTRELKQYDKVLLYGEVFIVLQNSMLNDKEAHIILQHEIDTNTFVNEHYLNFKKSRKVMDGVTCHFEGFVPIGDIMTLPDPKYYTGNTIE